MHKYILFMYLVIPHFAFGQFHSELSYGQNLTGELVSPSDIHLYSFMGSKGDRVWIRTSKAGSDVDASIKLKKGIEILSSAESAGGDSEIFDFTLPDDGVYDLEVYDKNSNDAGGYGLSLHKLNNPSYARQIDCGEDVVDALKTQVGIQVYQIIGIAGDKAIVQMRADNPSLEASFYIFHENGDLLKKSTRKSNPYAFIDDLTLEFSEQYSLFVFDDNGNDIGNYGLTYQSINNPNCGTSALECKEYINTSINQLAAIHAYRVNLETGFISKAMSLNNSFELNMQVFDPSGNPIFQQKVSGKALDAVIPQINTPGDHIILISDQGANDFSEYHLSFNKLLKDCSEPLLLCQTMEGKIESQCDLTLYYFSLPEQMQEIEIKEKDPVIEIFASTIWNNQFVNVKDNVKVKIKTPDSVAGTLIWLAVSDNGGNDIGRYSIRSSGTENMENTPPLAIVHENLVFTIPESGVLELNPKEIDRGSYDNCQIVSMTVAPNNFTCNDIGKKTITFSLTDNEGLITTLPVQIEIVSDLKLLVDKCISISPEEFDINACIPVTADATGGSGAYTFTWSNGASGANTQVCPADAVDLWVLLEDKNGCTERQSIWIPIGENVICHPNGKKVTLCHIPPGNDDNPQEICVALQSLGAHFGHGDKMGSCLVNNCIEDVPTLRVNPPIENTTPINNLKANGIVARKGEEVEILMKTWTAKNSVAHVELINLLGQRIYLNPEFNEPSLRLILPDVSQPMGIYYLIIRSLDGTKSTETIPIIIQ